MRRSTPSGITALSKYLRYYSCICTEASVFRASEIYVFDTSSLCKYFHYSFLTNRLCFYFSTLYFLYHYLTCFSLKSWASSNGDRVHYHERGYQNSDGDKVYIRQDQAKPDGEWMTLEGTVSFNELFNNDWTSATSAYEVLKIRVKDDPGTDIELGEVYFGLPPDIDNVEASPVPVYANLDDPDVCTDLVIGDGTAENARFVFPFYNNGRWNADSVTIEEETKVSGGTNKFYRVDHRTSYGSSLNFEMIPGCIQHGALYTFHGKFRLNSDTALNNAYIEVRYVTQEGKEGWKWLTPDRDIRIGGDEGDEDGWVTVEFPITFSEEFASYTLYEFYFRTYSNGHSYDDLARRNVYPSLDFDDISFTRNHGPIRGLVVGPEVDGCWGESSEVLITSHKIKYDSHQVRKITSIETRDDGNRNLVLDQAIFNPVTLQLDSDPETANEVALLNRNIKFGIDEVDLGTYNSAVREDMPQGGHLMVMHTPTVDQNLSGVEIRQFGQMGKAWRFPVNFHMCRSVDGSVVSKNVIREAYYKCVVAQGTDDLSIKDNVAFDTRGHCYALQDGSETGNTFEGNLGVYTRKIKRDYRPLSGESDHDPATFLISNIQNTWRGNVAAGSQKEGFWFELRQYVRGLSNTRLSEDGLPNPRRANMYASEGLIFENNTAHSNEVCGFRSHPDFWRPSNEVTIRNLKTYRNGYGVYLHYSLNVAFQGLYASDNWQKNVDINRADNTKIIDSTIIGYSDHFRKQVTSQSLWHRCKENPNHLLKGIELNYFQESTSNYLPGSRFENVNFSGFTDTGCARAAAFTIQSNERRGLGDTWSYNLQLKSITIEDGSDLFDAQSAEDALITDISINDVDASLAPATIASPNATAPTYGVVVSDEDNMKALANGVCTPYPEQGIAYCENTCNRIVHYLTSIFGTEDYRLEATDNLDSTRTTVFDGNMQMDWDWNKGDDGQWTLQLNQWKNNQ